MELQTLALHAPFAAQMWECRARDWPHYALAAKRQGGRFIGIWGDDRRDYGEGFVLMAALATSEGVQILKTALPESEDTYPDLSSIFPAAARPERALFDLLGLRAQGGDERAWLRHANWPQDFFALRRDAERSTHTRAADPDTWPLQAEDYAFVRVQGDGVHEIAVGPIHAGIIEPGHFRFSVSGEKVLRLEERLGFKHRGIAQRFMGMDALSAARLAGRISGDSTVAYAWAYAQALEAAADAPLPPRAAWLRALLLERERIANHLGDLGALGNDAALSFGLARFLRLKEDVLRCNHAFFGHRLLMDCVIPGGVKNDLSANASAVLIQQCDTLEREVRQLKTLYDEHAGLQDRFITTGRLTPALAAELGVIGLAGRASAQQWDLRHDAPCAPYDALDVQIAQRNEGDVAARVAVRFAEIFESLRLIRQILARLPAGTIHAPLPHITGEPLALGRIEGWRGEVFVALQCQEDGRLRFCHCIDPSWANWPALEHAIMGNIVPDFPLINKSFNLSYSGCDL